MAIADWKISDLATALEIVKRFTYLDLADEAYDSILTLDLNASCATNSYRPYVVAALFLYANPPRQGVISAEGVKWEDNESIIAGLMLKQEVMDAELDNIPNGWGIPYMKNQVLCGCKGTSLGSVAFVV